MSRTAVVAMFHGSIALGLAIGLAFGPIRAAAPAAGSAPQTGGVHGSIVNDDMRAGQVLVARPHTTAIAHGRWSTTEGA